MRSMMKNLSSHSALVRRLRAAEARLPSRYELRSLEQAEAMLTALAELAARTDDGYRQQVQAAADAVAKVVGHRPGSDARSWFRGDVSDHKVLLKKLLTGERQPV